MQKKYQILFCKISKNKWYNAKVLPKRFQLNGHTIGFCPQTQKLELHYKSPQSVTLVQRPKSTKYGRSRRRGIVEVITE